MEPEFILAKSQQYLKIQHKRTNLQRENYQNLSKAALHAKSISPLKDRLLDLSKSHKALLSKILNVSQQKAAALNLPQLANLRSLNLLEKHKNITKSIIKSTVKTRSISPKPSFDQIIDKDFEQYKKYKEQLYKIRLLRIQEANKEFFLAEARRKKSTPVTELNSEHS